MRRLFILMLFANLALTLVSLAVLPDRVAIHFGAGGMANGWASKTVNALIMTATHVFLFCVLYFSSHLVAVMPAWCVNLPHKEYWLSTANLSRTREKLSRFMWRFGAAVFALYFVMGLLTLQANRATPVRLNEWLFFPVFGLFLLYAIGSIIALYRAFRIPVTSSL